MNSKNFKVQESGNGKIYFISNEGCTLFLLKNGKVSSVPCFCWWDTKKEATIFLAGWLLLNRNFSALHELEHKTDLSQVDKEQQYLLGMKYKDAFGVTWTYYHKAKPKPYQFKPGDVVEFLTGNKRIIIADAKGVLHAVCLEGEHTSVAHKHNLNFIGCHYKKIGELKDFIGE